MATGYYDADGFWHYGEDDLADEGQGFSGVLNKATDAIPTAVRARVITELNSDETLRTAALANVSAAAQALDLGKTVGVETLPVADFPDVRAAFAFEDDSYPILINGDGSMTTREFETRYDIAEPGARAVFVFEDDSIAGVIRDDGTGLGGTTGSLWPAAARGTSLTQGADIPDPTVNRWQTLLATRLGKTIDNYGISGSRVEEIAWHAGAHPATITSSSAFPSTGPVVLPASGFDMDPWRASSNSVVAIVPVVAVTPSGAVMTGTLARTDTNNRTFTRTDGGAVVPAGQVTFRARPDTQDGQLLFLDTIANNVSLVNGGTQTLAQMKAWTREVTSRHTGPIVFWGLLDRGLAEAPGTATGDLILAYEDWASTEYGDSWYPVRRYLASQQALTDALIFDPTFTPTTTDTQTVAAGAVPPSFRASSGTIHQSLLAHKLMALYFHRELILRGVL